MDTCWERADLLALRLCCLFLSSLIVCIPFPYPRMVSGAGCGFPDHCLFISFTILFLSIVINHKTVCQDLDFYIFSVFFKIMFYTMKI